MDEYRKMLHYETVDQYRNYLSSYYIITTVKILSYTCTKMRIMLVKRLMVNGSIKYMIAIDLLVK